MNKIMKTLYKLLKIRKLKRIDKFFDDLSNEEFEKIIKKYGVEKENDNE